MNKISFFVIVLLLQSSFLFSQVAINADGGAPDASAILDLATTEKGFLLPRMRTSQQLEIENPAVGLVIYNLDSNDIYFFNGNKWLAVRDVSKVIHIWNCGDSLTINHLAGDVAPVSKIVVYGTVKDVPGESTKCWITSNLGATHQANTYYDYTEPSAGWYWQFNRMQGYKHDGVTITPAWTFSFIEENSEWLAANDPCALEIGSGWRIPTSTEWTNVDATGGWNEYYGPWNSALKIHVAGLVANDDGQIYLRGSLGYYWSSTQYDIYNSHYLAITNNSCELNIFSKTYGFPVRCVNNSKTMDPPTLSTTMVTNITQTSATGGGDISLSGGNHVIDRGVCWGGAPNPTTDGNHTHNGSGTGAFVSDLTGLTANTLYYVRSYAINSTGTSYGNELTFNTIQPWICGDTLMKNHVAGNVAPVSKTTIYETVGNIPGETSKCWITSNLGSDNQAVAPDDGYEAAAGWYWQFNLKQGYKHDDSNRTPNTLWITSSNDNSEWLSANDPCNIELGSGWRLPTSTEWTNVDESGAWTDWNGAWNSALKLHAAGYLAYLDGGLWDRGNFGIYWSSKQDNNTNGWHLYFQAAECSMISSSKAYGLSVRCIKD
jgi:uncharacterized protein (TIGR02145 family)